MTNIVKKYSLLLAGLSLAFFTVFLVTSSMPVFAQVDEACAALQEIDPTITCAGDTAENRILGIAETVIDVLSWIVGIGAVIVLIIAGLKYVFSSGDTNATQSARSMIIYALIGIVIVLFAQTIIKFVLNRIL